MAFDFKAGCNPARYFAQREESRDLIITELAANEFLWLLWNSRIAESAGLKAGLK
jgi:hypothetical protein